MHVKVNLALRFNAGIDVLGWLQNAFWVGFKVAYAESAAIFDSCEGQVVERSCRLL